MSAAVAGTRAVDGGPSPSWGMVSASEAQKDTATRSSTAAESSSTCTILTTAITSGVAADTDAWAASRVMSSCAVSVRDPGIGTPGHATLRSLRSSASPSRTTWAPKSGRAA